MATTPLRSRWFPVLVVFTVLGIGLASCGSGGGGGVAETSTNCSVCSVFSMTTGSRVSLTYGSMSWFGPSSTSTELAVIRAGRTPWTASVMASAIARR